MARKISINFREWHGWQYYQIREFDIWFNGYILNDGQISFLNKGTKLLDRDLSTNDDFDYWVRNAQGHFSFIISNKKKLLCSVDHVRTMPLFYTLSSTEIIVSNHAPDISKTIGTNEKEYNKQAALEIAMSGYTIGKKTLHPQISQLCAGELLIARDDKVEVREYYRYSPWKTKEKSKTQLKKELTEVSRRVLEDMVENADGRQFVVPLSAGNDSRFIASGLKELGVKDVFCFSYGTSNNFEVKTAEQVAAHLDYSWLHVPLSVSSQKKTFKENAFNDFLEFSDTLSNAQVLIDYSAVKFLKESDQISKDAIFVNGNSGDFITGGHINPDISIDDDHRMDQLIESVVRKHYSLWHCLKFEDNVAKIRNELEKYASHLMHDNNLTQSNFSEIGENMEWKGRQSKIVTTTQRSYEFHGYEWRLPMWDPIYMDFWEGVEKKYKINQSLYIETLLENNWGGVWGTITVNDFAIASHKLRLFRNFAKLFFIFFGKEAWHQFDKRFFAYFYDDTAATAIVPYSKAMFDICGARDRNSWIVKKYLYEKGIDIANHKFK
jgi:asparagine synthase (glutamine-hydrolysing)